MTDLITTDLVRLGAAWGQDKHDVIRALAGVVDDAGRATDRDQLVEDAFARESTSATGLPGGIAIPHCRTAGVETPTLAFARLDPPVDFGAKDGPADIAFLIAAPAGGDADHLTILTKLARALVKPAFTDALRSAESTEEVVDLITHEIGEAAPAKPVPASGAPSGAATPTGGEVPATTAAPAAGASSGAKPSLVAVTACPTGIAHTYMAAEALEAAAERAGVELHVETQGSAGSTPLAPATIAAAGAVIFAVDVGVRDRARFAGKPMVSSGVKRPIDDADAMIAEALRYAADPAELAEGRGHRQRGGRLGGEATQSFGATHPSGPDDRRLLHDPVRRRRRPADRPGVPARRLRDRPEHRDGAGVAADRGRLHALQPPRRRLLRPRPTPSCRTAASSPTSARSSSPWAELLSGSSSPRSPATSPTPSPTARASRPASSWARSPAPSTRASSAASSVASSPVSSPTGSPAGRYRRGCAG